VIRAEHVRDEDREALFDEIVEGLAVFKVSSNT